MTQSRPDRLPTTAPPGAMAGPDPTRWIALAILAIAQLMIVLDASIVNIALPQAQSALHISDANRQWVITAYTLAFGGLLLLGGRIADYAGRKRMLVVGLLGFAAASAFGGVAVNTAMLLSARALQGGFAALMAPAALSLISVTFTDPKERARAFGVYGGIAGGGAAIGLIAGGVLTEYASWRWCLLVNTPVALLAAVAAIRVLHESKATGKTSYDLPGAALVTGGLVALVYGFTEAAKPGVGWLDPVTLGVLALAVVLLAGFVTVETTSANPLLPMRIPLDRNRGGAYLAAMLAPAALFGMFLFLTYYFQLNLGYSPLKSGFAFLPFSAGIIVAAVIASQLLPRTGPKPLMLGGTISAAVGLALLLDIGQHTAWWSHVLPSEMLLSIGLGFVFVPASSTALVGVSNHDAGVASALLNTSQQIGGSLGTALLNTLYASAVSSYLVAHATGSVSAKALQPLAFIHGYHVAFAVGAGMLVLSAIVIAVLIKARKDDIPTDADAEMDAEMTAAAV